MKRSDSSSAQWRVVDHERERRALGEVRGEPVEAVQERVRRALVRPGRAGAGGSSPSSSADSAGAALQQPPALGGVRVAHAASKSWRATPNGNSRSSSRPRAASTSNPRSSARARAAASSVDLPEPGRRLDEHQPSVPGGGGVQRLFDDLDLGIPLEQFAQDSLPGQNPSALPRCAEGSSSGYGPPGVVGRRAKAATATSTSRPGAPSASRADARRAREPLDDDERVPAARASACLAACGQAAMARS